MRTRIAALLGAFLFVVGLSSAQTMNVTGNISASQVTSGTFNISLIPTGSSSSTVAIGNDARFLNATSLNGTSITSLTGILKLTSGTPSNAAAADMLALLSMPVNNQTGTTYTLAAGDLAKMVTISNASSVAVTLPQATGSFAAGWYTVVENRGSGTVTITPTTSTIDGASSLALNQNQGVTIASDGTNYYTFRGFQAASGSGTVNSGTLGHLSYYAGTGTAVSDMGADFTFATHTLTGGSSSIFDMSGASVTAGLKIPSAVGAAPTADGILAINTTNHTHVWGSNSTTIVGAAAATGTNTATTCTNQAVTAISGIAAPTCSTITSSFVDTSLAKTGTDINTSNQVTSTHLAAALPVNQGGTGTTSTLTGLVRGSGSAMTAAELSGDATTSGSNAVTVAKVNGVTYGSSPSTNTVPVVTGTNTVTYEALPTAALPTSVPVWTKYTVPYTSVTAAATTQAVTLVALTARQAICGIIEKTTTAYAGTGITGWTVTVGDSNGTSTTYAPSAYNLLAAVGNSNFIANNVLGLASFAGGNVQANFTSSGANLSNGTAGSVDFDVCTFSMP